jgi:hypothetical protein
MGSIITKFGRKLFSQIPLETQIQFSLNSIELGYKSVPLNQLAQLIGKLERLQLLIEDFQRINSTPKGKVKGWENETDQFQLEYSIMDIQAPWLKELPKVYDMPGMISREEIQYYHYIAKSYSGWGEVIELGPWFGHSTLHLVDALNKNQKFEGKKLHVYDDFVWRSSWMDPHYAEADRPNNHGDFRFIFERYAQHILDQIKVYQGKFVSYDGNENLPQSTWDNKDIEIIIVDCGRTLDANNAWFDIFSKNFVPNKTIIVMQDWRQHRERPRLWYNQTLDFTKQHPNFELIHEVRDGGIATFLYR